MLRLASYPPSCTLASLGRRLKAGATSRGDQLPKATGLHRPRPPGRRLGAFQTRRSTTVKAVGLDARSLRASPAEKRGWDGEVQWRWDENQVHM